MSRTPSVSSLHRYPVKSMAGQRLDVADVEPWGLAGDRRWMLVEAEGPKAHTFTTARRDPRLVVLRAEPLAGDLGGGRAGGIVLRGDGPGGVRLDDLVVPLPAAGTDTVRVEVWSSTVPAAPAGPAADAWVSRALGRPVRLVHLADPTARASDPTYSLPGDVVSFADGYPLLLTTTASLRALGDAIVEGSQGAEEPVGMDRFRPNVVVDGTEPWVEDDWRRVRIGDVVLRAVKGCARCVLTTVDPATGEKGREPLRTLARTRRFDDGVWFGVNLVPDVPAGAGPRVGRVAVGDRVEVLEAAPPGAGPLRRTTVAEPVGARPAGGR